MFTTCGDMKNRKIHYLLYISLVAIIVIIVNVSFASYRKKNNEIDLANTALETLKSKYKRPGTIPFPENNPYSDAKAHLGKLLFFETRISRSGVMSCATCHNPSFGWTNGQRLGVGNYHQTLKRKDPVISNLAWDELFFWDGRAEGLEAQVLGPIQAEGEMDMKLEEVITKLKDIREYQPLFHAAFPETENPITAENIAKAIATFERTVISEEAPFDHWIKGDGGAISDSAKRGFSLFNGKAKCSACHSSWRFSDGSFHDIGIDDEDIGRGKFVPLPAMQHAFKTMGLRNIERRAAYMHNGSMVTLEEVIDHYNNGFVQRESLSDEIKPLNLTVQEKNDLVEFLKTLTSKDKAVTLPDLPH